MNLALRTRHTQRGMNLLELMVTTTIMGIVLGVGVPTFTDFLATNRMASAANDLVTAIHIARTEAVKRRAVVTFCGSSSWASDAPDCDLGGGGDLGWIVFFDANGNVSVDPGDTVVLKHPPLPDSITIDIDADASGYMQFSGNGFPQVAAVGTPISNFQLCDHRGGASIDGGLAAGRWITVGVTGRPQVHRAHDEVQANPIGGCS